MSGLTRKGSFRNYFRKGRLVQGMIGMPGGGKKGGPYMTIFVREGGSKERSIISKTPHDSHIDVGVSNHTRN